MRIDEFSIPDGNIGSDDITRFLTSGFDIPPELTGQVEVVNIYVDTGATGSGDGTSWLNAYTSLSSAISSEVEDLVTSNKAKIFNVDASTGVADTTPVSISGYTTDITRNIVIKARYKTTKWDVSRYRLYNSTSSQALTIQVPFVTVDGLQIGHDLQAYAGSIYTVRLDRTRVTIKNCIIRGNNVDDVTDSTGIYIFPWSNNDVEEYCNIYNNVIYGYRRTSGDSRAILQRSPVDAYINVYNNTVHDNNVNYRHVSGLTRMYNNLFSDYDITLVSTPPDEADYNAFSGSTSFGGANDRINQTYTFVDEPNEDFELQQTDTGAFDQGTNLSNDPIIGITDDTVGTPRPQFTAYDIGAIETAEATNIVNLSSTEQTVANDTGDLFYSPEGGLIATLPNVEPFPSSVLDTTTIVYVDQAHPDASDANPGTEAAPFQTMQRGIDEVESGGKVIVKAGTYNERCIINSTATNSEWCVVQAQGSVTMDGYRIDSGSYVAIDGFTMFDNWEVPVYEGFQGGGVWLEQNVTHIYILNNHIEGFTGFCAVNPTWYGTTDTAAKDVELRGNTMVRCASGVHVRGERWLVHENDLSDLRKRLNSTSGDNDYFRYAGTDIVFRLNYMHDTLFSNVPGAHVDGWQTYYQNNEDAHRVLIEYNVVQGEVHQGIIIEGLGESHTDITIRRNVFADIAGWGCLISGSKRTNVEYNTFHNVVTHGAAFLFSAEDRRSTGTNKYNIYSLVGADKWHDDGTYVEYAYNIVDSEGYKFNDTEIVATDLFFADDTDVIGPDLLPHTPDDGLRLTVGSPGIGAGESGQDLGAYIYANISVELSSTEVTDVLDTGDVQRVAGLTSTEVTTPVDTGDLALNTEFSSTEVTDVLDTGALTAYKDYAGTEVTDVLDTGALSVAGAIYLSSTEVTDVLDTGDFVTNRVLSATEVTIPLDSGNLVTFIIQHGEFKDYFDREFDYGDTIDKVRDKDIEEAKGEAEAIFNPALYPDDEVRDLAFNYLTAHFLQSDLDSAQSHGQPNFLQKSRSADGVTESLAIPEWMMESDFVLYATTYYGKKFLMLSKPYLDGAVYSVKGTTQF